MWGLPQGKTRKERLLKFQLGIYQMVSKRRRTKEPVVKPTEHQQTKTGSVWINTPTKRWLGLRKFFTLDQTQGDCRKEPRRDPLCTKTKINQNS
jgi:hypothetical protein